MLLLAPQGRYFFTAAFFNILMHPSSGDAIKRLEDIRQSAVIVYCSLNEAGHKLQPADVAKIYHGIGAHGKCEKLDLVLTCDGGRLGAARSIAVLLQQYSKYFTVLVSRKARSAATLLCLGANEVRVSPFAEFGPLDPIVRAEKSGGEFPHGISAEDVRAFGEMCESWLGLKDAASRRHIITTLTQKIAPSTLGGIFRAERYVRELVVEMLLHQLPRSSQARRTKIANRLITGYSDHLHSLMLCDMKGLGLNYNLMSEAELTATEEIWTVCNREMTANTGVAAGIRTVVSAVICTRNFESWYVTRAPVGGHAPGAAEGIQGGGAFSGWQDVRTWQKTSGP